MNFPEKWYSYYYGEYSVEEFVKEVFFGNPVEMERFRRIINLIPPDTKSVLDVGCGDGVFYIFWKKNGI